MKKDSKKDFIKSQVHNAYNLWTKKNKIREAEELFNKLVKANKKDENLLIARAPFLRGIGKPAEALRDYAKAIKLNPKNPNIFNTRAKHFEEQFQLDRALQDYNKAISLAPKNYTFYLDRSQFFLFSEDKEKALADANKAVVLGPKNIECYLRRGFIYEKIGDYKKSLNDYDKAIKINPDFESYQGRAVLHETFGYWKEALSDYSKVIKKHKRKYGWIFIKRAIVFSHLNKPEKAIKDFNRAFELTTNYAWGYLRRAEFFVRLRDVSKSLIDIDNAIQAKPEPWVYSQAVEILAGISEQLFPSNISKRETILKYIHDGIKQEPKNSKLYFWQGLVLLGLRKYKQASTCFQKSLRFQNNFQKRVNYALSHFYIYWSKGLDAYYENSIFAAKKLFLSAQEQFQKVKSEYGKVGRKESIEKALEVYLQLIPLDELLSEILNAPDQLKLNLEKLSGLRESFGGLQKSVGNKEKEIYALLEAKGKICALLLSPKHPQSIKEVELAKTISEIRDIYIKLGFREIEVKEILAS